MVNNGGCSMRSVLTIDQEINKALGVMTGF